MGIDRYLICSSIHLIVAQRLVRRLCFHCAEEYQPAPAMLERLGERAKLLEGIPLRKGRGCLHCGNVGYWGRVAIFEMLELDATLREMIINEMSPEQIIKELQRRGTETLLTNGLRKIQMGVTTIDEILGVTSDSF